MSDVPSNAPESCPGTKSSEAGRAGPCDGCPNQSLCSSGQGSPVDPAVAEIASKLSAVQNILLVLSGKGGVGKSTVSAHFAAALARDESSQVGLLDIDICGPSIPQIMGCSGQQVYQSGSGWSPVFVQDNLAVMSVGFLLSSPRDAVIWRGPKKNGLIKQFLRDVDWGELEWLIVDTPPGTSDEHLSCVQYLEKCNVRGAILVTTPQEISLQDVRKQINFCRKVKLPIVGVVENMSGFVCPHCSHESQVFPPTTGGAAAMCESMTVPLLGSIPLDPRLGQVSDAGEFIFSRCPDAPAAKSYTDIIQRVRSLTQHTEGNSEQTEQ